MGKLLSIGQGFVDSRGYKKFSETEGMDPDDGDGMIDKLTKIMSYASEKVEVGVKDAFVVSGQFVVYFRDAALDEEDSLPGTKYSALVFNIEDDGRLRQLIGRGAFLVSESYEEWLNRR